MTEKEQIVRLKCIAPEIDYLIDEIEERGASEFFYKRLVQLAKKAKEKYQFCVELENTKV